MYICTNKHLKTRKMYKVQISGIDCDGFSSNKIYEFDSNDEAVKFVEDYNGCSDGLTATLIGRI